MASGPITSWQLDGETVESVRLYFWAPKSLQMVTAAMKLKDTPWKENYDKYKHHIKKQRYHFADKGLSTNVLVFPVVMYGCEG